MVRTRRSQSNGIHNGSKVLANSRVYAGRRNFMDPKKRIGQRSNLFVSECRRPWLAVEPGFRANLRIFKEGVRRCRCRRSH